MFDLIKFEFKRITASPLLYIVLGLSLLFGVISGVAGYASSSLTGFMSELVEDPGSLTRNAVWAAFTGFYSPFPIMGALFVTLFVGNDMSSGFLRNKIIGGHKRSHIFFSYVITQTAVAIVELVIFTAAAVTVLLVKKVEIDLDGGKMLIRLLVLMFSYISMIFLYTAFTLAVRKRAITIVFSVIFAFSLSTIGFISYFGDYPSKELNKFDRVAEGLRSDMKSAYNDVSDYILPEDDDTDPMANVDFYFDNMLVPNKPFYYAVRAMYIVTDAGISTDYGISFLEPRYEKSHRTSLTSYVNALDSLLDSIGDIDVISSKVEGYRKELKSVNTETDYTMLNTVYLLKTFAWSCVWLGGGYLIFRKKDLF